jgi:DNA invertase Pin-like site-specific DNA recombinase
MLDTLLLVDVLQERLSDELERSLIIERIKAGLKKAEAAGHRPGRKIGAAGPSRCTLWRRAKAAAAAAQQA